jgi:hypothetical protein
MNFKIESSSRPAAAPGKDFTVAVIYTSGDATVAALQTAASLASRLKAHIVLVGLQLVPYPRLLNNPPVQTDFQERHLCAIARQAHVETEVRIYLCRDPLKALEMVLDPYSPILIGGRKRPWPTAESRLARALRRAGHEVIFTVAE